MSIQAYQPPSRRVGRSIVAILAGLLVNALPALAIDQVFHVLDVYPPWGVPMTEASDNALALSYRVVLGVLGCYVTARLAPGAPMKHALALGAIGTVLSFLGLLAAFLMNLGSLWYPIALVLVAMPCAWLGGTLHRVVWPSAHDL